MQGTSWHYVNRWELKTKDEFEFEEKDTKQRRKKKKKKHKKEPVNYVELAKKQSMNEKKKYHGSFKLKFDDGEEQVFIIDKNISNDAEIVKKVYSSQVGETIIINNEKIILVDKRMI